MAVITIRKAQREGARLIVGLAGVSGSGKTYTALQLAYGLANCDGNKVGFLDTENRRGSLYADILPGKTPFLIGDLYPPFSPTRYIEAIQEFERAGVEVLVIDSATHEWEGTGGCIELAEAGNPRMPNWNKAKAEHKRFMNAVLQCNMHIIFCVRAREKDKPEKIDGKTEYVKLGLQPIQEKNFMFEMTASVMIHDQGARQDVLKCPAALQKILGRGNGYLTHEDGKELRAWVDGAVQLDPKVEAARNALLSRAEQGMEAIKTAWTETPPDIKNALGRDFLEELKASAKGYDDLRAAASAQEGNNLDLRKTSSAPGQMDGSATTGTEPPDTTSDAGAPPLPAGGFE